jgi:hypothetical protein
MLHIIWARPECIDLTLQDKTMIMKICKILNMVIILISKIHLFSSIYDASFEFLKFYEKQTSKPTLMINFHQQYSSHWLLRKMEKFKKSPCLSRLFSTIGTN